MPAEDLKPLMVVGPFQKYNTTTEAYYLDGTESAAASNVDTTINPDAFTTAAGRALVGTFGPLNYLYDTIDCIVPFYSYAGEFSNTLYGGAATSYIVSLHNSANPLQTGVFYITMQSGFPNTSFFIQQLTYATPFTQAVQFGDALWTNGGQKIYYVSTTTAPYYKIQVDTWQTQVQPSYAFKIYFSFVAGGGSTQQNYQYAVTWRRANSWYPNPFTTAGSPGLIYYPDLDTYQESSPIFTPNQLLPATSTPCLAVDTAAGTLTTLEQGYSLNSNSGAIYLGALYRWSTANPTFTFVDYLRNLPQSTANDGFPCFEDTATDASLANNAVLTLNQDPPPLIGQVYPGPAASSYSIENPLEALAQQAFTYPNPGYIAKYKNRMWCFTMYPTQPLLGTPTGGVTTPRVQLQPQLWWSNAGLPFAFNSDTGFVLVGPEDSPGNYAIDSNIEIAPPWNPYGATAGATPGLLEPPNIPDTPMGLVSCGSILVMFKTLSTWIMFGDSPSDFAQSIRKAFDIGCIASDSVVAAEGGVFFLAYQGVYFFDGGAPSYIGEDIRDDIDSVPLAQQQLAYGSYKDRTYNLSVAGTTYSYYVPEQKWNVKGYSIGSTISDAACYNGTQDQIVLASVGPYLGTGSTASIQLSYADEAAANDLGAPVVGIWESNISDSQAPGILKSYNAIVLTAPIQQGSVNVTLLVDGAQAYTQTWDMRFGSTAKVATIPQGVSGYSAQVVITATTVPYASPVVVRSVVVTGAVKHALVSTAPNDGTGINV